MRTGSAIYEGKVRHRRFEPVEHVFEYRMFMMYLDLDELPSIFQGTPLWSANRPAPARFRREDFLGPADVPLKQAVLDKVESVSGERPRGRVHMLAHLRYFGHVFNPVVFYYVHDRGGDLDHIVAEITNTPWKERHSYVLRVPRDRSLEGHRFRFFKEFHVSPFMDMDMVYDWRFTAPGERLRVHMENHKGGRRWFDATLDMERKRLTPGALNRALVRYPFLTARVVAGIYLHAARLKLKGAEFHPHPAKRAREAGAGHGLEEPR